MTNELLPVDMTVNEVICLHPQTIGVFNRFGIDACCGGSQPIVEAAARDGADPVALMRELLRVLQAVA